MSRLSTWASSWATTERRSPRLEVLEQGVVEDDPLRRAEPVDVGVDRGAAPAGVDRGRPRRLDVGALARARARRCAPCPGSQRLEVVEERREHHRRQPGEERPRATTTAALPGIHQRAAEAAHDQGKGDGADAAGQDRADRRSTSASRSDQRAQRLGREPHVHGALVGPDVEGQRGDPERRRRARRPPPRRRGPAARRRARAPGGPRAGRPATSRTSTAPSATSPPDHEQPLARRGSRGRLASSCSAGK